MLVHDNQGQKTNLNLPLTLLAVVLKAARKATVVIQVKMTPMEVVVVLT